MIHMCSEKPVVHLKCYLWTTWLLLLSSSSPRNEQKFSGFSFFRWALSSRHTTESDGDVLETFLKIAIYGN